MTIKSSKPSASMPPTQSAVSQTPTSKPTTNPTNKQTPSQQQAVTETVVQLTSDIVSNDNKTSQLTDNTTTPVAAANLPSAQAAPSNWRQPAAAPFQMPKISTDLAAGFEEPFGCQKEKTDEELAEEAEQGGPILFR